MVRFGGQQMEAMMSRFNVDEAVPIQNPLVDRLVESSQKRVEGANFDVRKHLLEYDDVLNQQREKIYAQRERIFTKPDLSDDVTEMLETEVEQRLAQSQEQVEESWKILSWLMQIQPTLRFYDEVYPSYTNHLLLEQVFSEHPDLTRAEAPEVFLDLAQKGFQAEQEHILNVLEGRFQSSEFRYQRQLEERRETLDTYVEGLALADDEGQQRNWTDIRDELSGLLRTRFSLSQADWRALLEEDPYPIKEKLEAEMEDYLKQIEVKRLVGGTERTLKTTLDLSAKDFEGRDWEEINAILFEAVNNLFALREQRFFGDEDQGTIARDLAAELKDVPEGKIDRQLAIELLRTAREGKRSTFDKKSHRRIWVRTNRLNYAYYAAQFLNVEDYEALQGDILAHLKGAQNAILRAWGRSERQRLGDLTLAALDGDLREGLRESIGADQYQRYTERTLAEIPDEVVAEIEFEFGRFAMSQIYRELLLRVISELWVDYLTEMEALRVSIGLEAYAQRDPLVQYKTKAFDMFRSLMRDMRQSVVTRMFTFRPRDVESVQAAVDELKV
jgi:preprotein translocase subunit SecA